MAWYDVHARDLPWRRPGTTPWEVLVSEVMSQQTPVARVIPAWQEWMRRWPGPTELAQASPDPQHRSGGGLGELGGTGPAPHPLLPGRDDAGHRGLLAHDL